MLPTCVSMSSEEMRATSEGGYQERPPREGGIYPELWQGALRGVAVVCTHL